MRMREGRGKGQEIEEGFPGVRGLKKVRGEEREDKCVVGEDEDIALVGTYNSDGNSSNVSKDIMQLETHFVQSWLIVNIQNNISISRPTMPPPPPRE